jgi:heme oxygenase
MIMTTDRRFIDGAGSKPNCDESVHACSLELVDDSVLTKRSTTNCLNVSTSNVRQRLRHETRAEHDAIECTLGLMQPALSLTEYQRCITKFYGYYRPVERQLAACLEGSVWDAVLSGRRKSSLLQHDLQCLGVIDPDATPVCAAIPALTTPAAAFGCLYVIEGATLGGQIISGHVASRFGYSKQHGAAFFNGYGQETGAMWRTFGNLLTTFSATSNTDDEIVAAAVSTFQTLRLWCAGEEAA